MIEQCLQVSKPTSKSQEVITMSHHSVFKAKKRESQPLCIDRHNTTLVNISIFES